MWLAKQSKRPQVTADTDLGLTSIAGERAGVVTRGEVRELPVFGPGGYVWLPDDGNTVLVIKGGPGGEEQCAAGMKQASAPEGMRPGEVYLHAGKSSVWLHSDGTIELRGDVRVKGSLQINGIACNYNQEIN